MLGARDRMARHEMHARGHVRSDMGDRLLLDRAHVRQDGALGEVRCDRPSQRLIGAKRRAQHDEIGTLDARLRARVSGIDDAERKSCLAATLALGAADDALSQAVALHPARDRGADEPDAHEGDALEEGPARHG